MFKVYRPDRTGTRLHVEKHPGQTGQIMYVYRTPPDGRLVLESTSPDDVPEDPAARKEAEKFLERERGGH
jgi:hypothetical protein